jgi:hypothetical protein
MICRLLLCACLAVPPLAAAASAANADISADLQMAADSAPFRHAADAFIAQAMAGDAAATQAMLSRALLARSGEAAVRRTLDAQILPFFIQGRSLGRSVTITRSTDANGQAGFAFYMWLSPGPGAALRPFTVYTVQEQGRIVVANIVPDRLVEGRHR